jgi:methyl-accepting chemotaxis protein
MSAVKAVQAFRPAITLFDRLTFAKKFLVVGLVLLAPLGYVVYSYLGQEGTQIGFNAKERDGVVYVQPSAQLLGALVETRAEAVREAIDQAASAPELDRAKQDVASAVKAVDAADAKKGAGLKVHGEWSKLKSAIGAATGRNFYSAKEAFDAYNKLSEGARTLIVDAGNNSNLILDPELASYYLMDNTINKLPLLADTVGQAADLQRMLGAGRGWDSSTALRIQLAVYQGTIATTLDQTKVGFKTAFGATKDGALKPALSSTIDAVDGATKPVIDIAAGVVAGDNPVDATSASMQASRQAIALEEKTLPQLDHLLQVRIGGFAGAKHQVLWIVALATILSTYLFIGFFLAVQRSLAAVRKAVGRVGEGDLTADVTDVRSRDEIGGMARAVQAMIENVRSMVAKVAQTASDLGSASQQMASTAEEAGRAVGEITNAVGEVAQGAERQVQVVEQAKSVTVEMAQAAQSGAENALETATAAQQARSISGEGVASVESATEAMKSVRDSSLAVTDAIRQLGDKSGQIGGIVETITGIAGQTNLLALNAAIEAARAGEQGRGFAVVAEEVRKLAEESQRAAASISGLIAEIQSETQRTVEVVEDGAKRTEDGVAVVEQAREAFLNIGSSVEEVSGRVEQIASAIQQLAASSQKVQTDIAEVASVAQQSSASTEEVSASTQETSASTQEIAASARNLSRTAEELERLVGQFRLS